MRAALKHPLVASAPTRARKRRMAPLADRRRIHAPGARSRAILGDYVREEKLLTLEEAIRKMTSQAASRMHLCDRGILRPGIAADIIVFDPATIRDVATFEDPNHYSVGVKDVLVNGQAVVVDGRISDARPGRALRGWATGRADVRARTSYTTAPHCPGGVRSRLRSEKHSISNQLTQQHPPVAPLGIPPALAGPGGRQCCGPSSSCCWCCGSWAW